MNKDSAWRKVASLETAEAVEAISLPFYAAGLLGFEREVRDMTSLAEAESKFGDVIRRAGGAIFGIEKSPSIASKQDEKLQIGTTDGFVKIAVSLSQPNIDVVLRERTVMLVKHAEELRKSSGLVSGSPSIPWTSADRFRTRR